SLATSPQDELVVDSEEGAKTAAVLLAGERVNARISRVDRDAPTLLTRYIHVAGIIALVLLSFSPNMDWLSNSTISTEQFGTEHRFAGLLTIHSPPFAWFATTVLLYSVI